jgi:hypothetical protein
MSSSISLASGKHRFNHVRLLKRKLRRRGNGELTADCEEEEASREFFGTMW